MNEKDLSVLEQYEVQVQGFRRGRGSFLVETDQGLKLFAEFSGTEKRLQFQNRICEAVGRRGIVRADRVLPNREGNLISRDREERGFILKDWFEGRECSTRSEEDILRAVRILAQLHREMRITPEKENEEGYTDLERFRGIPLEQEFQKRIREMKKARAFMRGKNAKTPFELKFLQTFDVFIEQAVGTEEKLAAGGDRELYEECLQNGCVCHGDYNQHHIYLSGKEAAVVDYSRSRYDVQVTDLYQFLRKIMEKQNWDGRLGTKMLREYGKIRPLSQREMTDLRLRLSFPEKFWKLANHYYNSRKSRMPEKGMEKLITLENQEERRQKFIKIVE